jgi:hypothetical protein
MNTEFLLKPVGRQSLERPAKDEQITLIWMLGTYVMRLERVKVEDVNV